MGESRSECMPWLDEEGGGPAGGVRVATATVMEGAEVVRTAAVSYATPILHQVFIQSGPGGGHAGRHGNRSAAPSEIGVVALSSQDSSGASPGPFRVAVAPATAASLAHSHHHHNGLVTKVPGDGGGTVASTTLSTCGLSTAVSASAASPSSVPLWVFSSSLISSSSVVLRPITHFSTSSTSSTSSSPASPLSASSPPILSLPLCSVGAGKSDDELTSLSWLQDSNLLMGTALSPIKPQPHSNPDSTSSPGSSSPSGLSPVMPPSGERKKSSRRSSNAGSRKESVAAGSSIGLRGEDGSGKEGLLKRGSKGEPPRVEADDLLKAESPTSDYGEESCDAAGDGNEEAKHSSGLSQSAPAQPIPYNPKIHVKAKPPFSFSCLIFMAIEESPTKALPVKEIYSWILDHYPYYRNAPTGWKNSVRHNLSLNKCFSKVEKAPNLGKGSLWMVDPTFRPNLLQAMSKTPLSPQGGSGFDTKNSIVSNKAIINTKYLYGLTSRTPDKIISLGDFVVQNEVEVCPSSTATAAFPCQQVPLHPEAQDASTKSSLQLRQTKNTPAFNQSSPELPPCASDVNPVSSESSSSLEGEGGKKHGGAELRRKPKNKNYLYTTSATSSSSPITSTTPLNTPNPELFPRLAKRLLLESSKEEQETLRRQHFEPSPIGVQSEDVDAAAAMLVLKHGPRVLSPYHENFANLQTSSSLSGRGVVNGSNTRDHSSSESSSDSGLMVISSSPSLDHAYVSRTARKSGPFTQHSSSDLTFNRATPASWSQAAKRAKDVTSNASPASSVDEAFFDDSFENEATDTTVTSREPRPFEEADALLNLASVATSLASGHMLMAEDELGDTMCCSESQSFPLETHYKTHSRMKASFKKVLPSRRLSRNSSNGSIKGTRKTEVDIGINLSQQREESSRSDTHQKSLKRKANFPANKLAPSKKPANFPLVFPPKSGLNRPSHNNNSNRVLNRNKHLKIKKVLGSNKAKC